MPPMPVYYVGKGSQFGVLDRFDGAHRERYDEAIARLQGAASLEQLAEQRRLAGDSALSTNDVAHFRNDWLTNWWKGKNVALVLRAGILRALQLALPQPHRERLLPVEAIWVCAQEDVFHVYVNEGPNQVTMIVYTPPPDDYSARGPAHPERIWVIKTRDDFDLEEGTTRLNPGVEWPVLIEHQLQYSLGSASES
jgi:hypothetical protein